MDAFNTLTGLVAPLDRANIDTDAIIPKQFLKSIKKSGFGNHLFDDWRYLDAFDDQKKNVARMANPDFILNQSPYDKAQILLARENFGCGSSREHAVWALTDFGFRAILAPSYSDIFYSNCFKNGLLPVRLLDKDIGALFEQVYAIRGFKLTVDLEAQLVKTSSGQQYSFDIASILKDRLLRGLDDIDLTLELADQIKAYEDQRKKIAPWLFKSI